MGSDREKKKAGRPAAPSDDTSSTISNGSIINPVRHSYHGDDLKQKPLPPATGDTPAATAATHRAEDELAPEEQRTPMQTALIVGALASALFLAALDITIVTVAIPTITQEFQSTAGYTWIGSAYMLSSAAMAPMWGKISVSALFVKMFFPLWGCSALLGLRGRETRRDGTGVPDGERWLTLFRISGAGNRYCSSLLVFSGLGRCYAPSARTWACSLPFEPYRGSAVEESSSWSTFASATCFR